MRRILVAVFFLVVVLSLLPLWSILTNEQQGVTKPLTIALSDTPSHNANQLEYTLALENASSAYDRWLSVDNIQPEKDQQRFYKVDYEGNLVEEHAQKWSCIYDSLAGLLWEVKENNGSWQDRDQTYSWYINKQDDLQVVELISNELEPLNYLDQQRTPLKNTGIANKGRCFDIRCDTQAYVYKANDQWLCSASQWRLPEAFELALLDHTTHYQPDVDINFFPNTVSGYYWSITEVPNGDSLAWAVDFTNGFPYIVEKRIAYHIRLVTDAPWLDYLKIQ